MTALTALQAVRDKAKAQEGRQVLITGAAGGVGTFAVQLAHAPGARVMAVASTPELDAVRALGADHVIDYTCEDFPAGPRRYDAIIDIAGQPRSAGSAPETAAAVRPLPSYCGATSVCTNAMSSAVRMYSATPATSDSPWTCFGNSWEPRPTRPKA